MSFDLSSLLGLVPVDPNKMMDLASKNITDATDAANKAASSLEGARKSIEQKVSKEAEEAAKAYATEVKNRESDLTVTADSSASLLPITPTSVEAFSEFQEENTDLMNFEDGMLPMDTDALQEIDLLQDIDLENPSPDQLLQAQTQITGQLNEMAGDNIVTQTAKDYVDNKVATAVGDGTSALKAVEKFGETAVSDPEKLIEDPSITIDAATKVGTTYLKYSTPGAAFAPSVTDTSIMASVATKAMGNSEAIKANPSILDTCLEKAKGYTGDFTDCYQSRIENALSDAVNDPASFTSGNGFSDALNKATSDVVRKAMSGTGSSSSSLFNQGLDLVKDKVSAGAIDAVTGTKVEAMFKDAMNMPGMKRVGEVGTNLAKKIMNKSERDLFSTVNRFISDTQSKSTRSMLDNVKNLF